MKKFKISIDLNGLSYEYQVEVEDEQYAIDEVCDEIEQDVLMAISVEEIEDEEQDDD